MPTDVTPPAELDLLSTLQLLTQRVTSSLGFGVAVLNLVQGEHVVAVAVSGPDEVREALAGARQHLDDWRTLLAASTPWGELRFLDHRTAEPGALDDMLIWVPESGSHDDDVDAWHPQDALFAPLVLPDGELVGMLSVDLPLSGRRPGDAACRALEAFGLSASLTIAHARRSDEAREGRARFRAVFESSPIPVGLLDPRRRYLDVNPAFCRFLGRTQEQLLGHDPAEFTHPDDLAAGQVVSLQARAGERPEPVEKRYLLPDGSVVWGRLHLVPLAEGGAAGLTIAQVEDVTQRRRAEDRLRQQARHDALTGLPNRAETMVRLQAALAAGAASGCLTAVFFCDLDKLKGLNDTYGHGVGDAYLREVAARLRRAVRDEDTVGRLGGDEFVVVLPGLATPTEAVGLAGRVIEQVRAPWHHRGDRFTPSVSIGIAYSSGGTSDADTLVAQADAAMYQAKVGERGSWQVYDAAVRAGALPHYELRGELPRALERGELCLHYQPIVDLRTREVVGEEALLRWQHPRRGLLMPGQFLDVVLDSEFETPVTDWAVASACRHAAQRGVRVNVNVSSVQVGRRELPEVVGRALHDADLPPSMLALELTEDRLLARPDGPELLAALGRTGVGLALDDFGSGYAGLQYLLNFPALTAVKLDRSFTAALGANPVAARLVDSVVALSRSCGLALVAEGIETGAQLEQLSALGVVLGQGYLLGRPAAPG